MSDRTGIPYLDATWNPVTGCTPVSAGCAHCWAIAWHQRFRGGDFSVQCHPDRLNQPVRWRKPRRIGVCFMGDLFHEETPDEFILAVFEAMQAAGHHTYFLLTKRADGMRRFFQQCEDWQPSEWPHVWLGVSVEDQATADERIPLLLQTPAAHRWVSVEPMLGPVQLGLGALYDHINWVVLGGESGPHARPMHPDWVWSVRDQCVSAGVPFYYKQGPSDSTGDFYHPILEGREWREMPA